MTLRAKFIVNEINNDKRLQPVLDPDTGATSMVQVEAVAVSLIPATGDNAGSENLAVWPSEPSGGIRLAGMSAEAAAGFEMGSAYFVDITPAG